LTEDSRIRGVKGSSVGSSNLSSQLEVIPWTLES
jgi:hypothetical protein